MKNNLKKYLQDFIDASERAAIECSKLIGMGDKIAADDLATKFMRETLNSSEISAIVKIGEGEMDEAPMLFNGEKLGLLKNSASPFLDIAADPLEGTNLCANGYPGAMTSICFSSHESILNCPDIYMEKIIVKNGFGTHVSLLNSFEDNLKNLAKSMQKKVHDLKIIMLNRPRHQIRIDLARSLGAKVFLINDGDIGASLNVFLGHFDMYCGSGGAPEGVLSAACAKSFFGGNFSGKLIIDNEEQEKKAKAYGICDFEKIYQIDDLISGECFFIATGVTDGEILKGVHLDENQKYISTQTLICNSFQKSNHILTSKRYFL